MTLSKDAKTMERDAWRVDDYRQSKCIVRWPDGVFGEIEEEEDDKTIDRRRLLLQDQSIRRKVIAKTEGQGVDERNEKEEKQ